MKLSQRRENVRDCVYLFLYWECVCVWVWAKVPICYNTYSHWRWPFVDPIENKLQQFFIFFRFVFLIISFIFPHFVRLPALSVILTLLRYPCLSIGPAGRCKLIYTFFLSSIQEKWDTLCQCMYIGFIFGPALRIIIMWKTECIKHINNILLSTNRMKLLNISFWWLFYAKTMSIMILLPDWIEKRIKSSDQHTHTYIYTSHRHPHPVSDAKMMHSVNTNIRHIYTLYLTRLKGTIP